MSKRGRPLGPYTPSANSNNEGNIAIAKIEEIEKYIKDNFTVVKPETNAGAGLRISINPGEFKDKDGNLFDRVYSSEANLWYPDGDEYVMRELGIEFKRRKISNNRRGRKSRKTRRARKARKV
jgi:hypothetical protein